MHSPGAIAFQVGPLVIRWYGILMALSIVIGLWIGHRQARREGLPADDIITIGQWSILAGLVGARLYEVVFNWDYYGQFPRKIFAVWEGVLATDAEYGVVSPGAIGFDINCGVRLLGTGLDGDEVKPRLREIVEALYATIPTGVGAAATVSLTPRDLIAVMADGAAWAVARGYGDRDDLEHIESGGRLRDARPDAVSPHARERGLRQLGSLGSGNHFLELQVVEEVYDADAAARFGIRRGQLTVMIHTGSRGVGHQVCTDYLKTTGAALKRYGISVPDRQLACAPLDSPEAADYLGAMRAAANFAFANRQVLAATAGDVLQRVLGVAPRDF